MAVAEGGAGRRELDAAGQQVGLLADVGDRVLGELGERLVDPLALLGRAGVRSSTTLEHPAAQQLASPTLTTPPPAIVTGSPSREQLEGIATSTSIRRTPARASSSGPAFG